MPILKINKRDHSISLVPRESKSISAAVRSQLPHSSAANESTNADRQPATAFTAASDRPPSAFQLFVSEVRPDRVLKEYWKEMTPDQKRPYHDMRDKADRVRQVFPACVYHVFAYSFSLP